MKPGDLIEWFYTSNDKAVKPREELWSSIDKHYVTIGGTHLLISRADEVLTFLTMGSDKGLLRAREDDSGSEHECIKK